MNDKLHLVTDPNKAMIAASILDGRTICTTGEIFAVAVSVTKDDMTRLMGEGVKFCEVEDSTCVIGFQLGLFPDDKLYEAVAYEADEMRDAYRMYGFPECLGIWEARKARYAAPGEGKL